MAFALRLTYPGTVEDNPEYHYIHKLYSTERNNTSPKTTSNMNFSLLFASESEAKRWREKKGLPTDFEIVFIPVSLPVANQVTKERKKYYNVLKSDGKSLTDSIPDFMR